MDSNGNVCGSDVLARAPASSQSLSNISESLTWIIEAGGCPSPLIAELLAWMGASFTAFIAYLVSSWTRKPSGNSRIPATKSPLISLTHR